MNTLNNSTGTIAPEVKEITTKMPFRSLMEPLLVFFNRAAEIVLPGKSYHIAYSIPGGVYGYFTNYSPADNEIKKIRAEIRKLVKERTPLSIDLADTHRLENYFKSHKRNDIIQLLGSKGYNASIEGMRLAHINGNGELFLDDVQANYEKLDSFDFFAFRDGFMLIADPAFFERVMPAHLESSKYFKRFDESEESMKQIGISNIDELNRIIRKGELSDFIKISEAFQAKRIGRIADNIIAHPRKPHLIFLAGPTSSGKTTSANRLAIELKVLGKKVLIMSLDNFYLPHSRIPFDPETGLQNFELITALDLELFRKTISALMQGKEVYLPKYHFDGKGATPEPNPTRITDDTYIIVEGIHGLNPELWESTMDVESYRMYVSCLTTLNIHDHLPLSTSDHRLIRRLVRDNLFRGYDFNETIKRWPDVMMNEYHSIFPFQESAHAIFNSALIYEVAVFAHYAPAILRPEKAENEAIRQQVLRLNRILSLFIPIDPSDIPPTSILREFIGGSSFKY